MTIQEMRKDLRACMAELLKPLGFRTNANEFLRMVDDVHQIVRIDTLPRSDSHEWRFRITEGATTERLVDIAYDGDVKKFHPAYGPLYREPRGIYKKKTEYYSVTCQEDYNRVKQEVLDTLVSFTIPFLKEAISERAIVRTIKYVPPSSCLTAEGERKIIEEYEAIYGRVDLPD